ncbi:DedA family protein [Micromonospora sp. NPDC092111]|uniref:DedA family protein n=1 Tax=Micromonospora sp. NPDC092111 TaxID=3364289 RepID=UPI0038299431
MPELLTDVASPTWAYLVLLGLLVADAFVPVIPTQVVMITGGALTVVGGLSLPLTIGVGALGVFAGDLACYLLGRSAPDRRSARHAEPSRVRRVAGRVTRGLRRPGPMTILLCRFVPGGRMAACFSAGRSRYPYRLFLCYEAAAAVGWASYGALVGHLGGTALTGSAWRLGIIAAAAAAGFAAAGWAMTVVGARASRAEVSAD